MVLHSVKSVARPKSPIKQKCPVQFVQNTICVITTYPPSGYVKEEIIHNTSNQFHCGKLRIRSYGRNTTTDSPTACAYYLEAESKILSYESKKMAENMWFSAISVLLSLLVLHHTTDHYNCFLATQNGHRRNSHNRQV
jgi:hypothetical protein